MSCHHKSFLFHGYLKVKANDIDEGSNAQIKYRISSLTKPEFIRLFTLDPITGWIHVQWEVDYEIHKKVC